MRTNTSSASLVAMVLFYTLADAVPTPTTEATIGGMDNGDASARDGSARRGRNKEDRRRARGEEHKAERDEKRKLREQRRQQRRQAKGQDTEWLARNLTALWAAVRQLQEQHPGLPTLDVPSFPLIEEGRDDVPLFDLRSSLPLPCDKSFFTEDECSERSNMCVADPSLAGNSSTIEDAVCSGRGECCCGDCYCQAPYTGIYCECSPDCERGNGRECSGRGDCVCGACRCAAAWTGEACDCTVDTRDCTNDQTGNVCNNHGSCACGRCTCESGWSGALCEDWSYSAGRCETLKPCVLCGALNKTMPQCQECSEVSIVRVPEIESSGRTCVMVNLGCLLTYSYDEHSDGTYTISVPEDLAC